MDIKNTDLPKKLEKSGLSQKESLVYTSLIELGGAYPSRISQYTGLNRTTVYEILLHLSVKGLITEIEKKNKLFYQIEEPKKLLRFAKDKMRIAEDEIFTIEKILPDIEGIVSLSSHKPKIKYFEGESGALAIYADHINVDKPYEMLAWANSSELEVFLPSDFFEHYRKTKEEKNITTRGILPGGEEGLSFLQRRYSQLKKEIMPEIRYVDPKDFPFKAEITIYAENKVSIVNLLKGVSSGVIIEDDTIHGLMKMIFELSWKGAEKNI